jgi:hypothetical protein
VYLPVPQCRDGCLLDRLLRNREIADNPGEGGQQPGPLDPDGLRQLITCLQKALLTGELDDRSNLDRPIPGAGNLRGHGDGLVQVGCFEQVEAS